MIRSNLVTLYLLLSALNGVVPFILALLFSASGLWALLVWLAASLVSFLLICLVCMRSAISKMEPEPDTHSYKGELEKAVAYR